MVGWVGHIGIGDVLVGQVVGGCFLVGMPGDF